MNLRVTSEFDPSAGDFVTDWEFLNAVGNALPPKAKRPALLYALHQLAPVFYLSAVRDGAKEFQPRSAFWGRFLRNPSMPAGVRAKLEKELAALNAKIIEAEPRLQAVQNTLAKAQEVVALSDTDTVTIEALPAHLGHFHQGAGHRQRVEWGEHSARSARFWNAEFIGYFPI